MRTNESNSYPHSFQEVNLCEASLPSPVSSTVNPNVDLVTEHKLSLGNNSLVLENQTEQPKNALESVMALL